MKRFTAFSLGIFYLLFTTGALLCVLNVCMAEKPAMKMSCAGMTKDGSNCCGSKTAKNCCKLQGSTLSKESLQPSPEKKMGTMAFLFVLAFPVFRFRQFITIRDTAPGNYFFPPPKTGRLLSILFRSLQI